MWWENRRGETMKGKMAKLPARDADDRRDNIPTTPAGIAGGQGRTPEEVEDSVRAAGICVSGLVILVLLAAIVQIIGGCLGN